MIDLIKLRRTLDRTYIKKTLNTISANTLMYDILVLRGGTNIGELIKLKEELNNLLANISDTTDTHTLYYVTEPNYDPDTQKMTANIYINKLETVGQWKTRLSELKKRYGNNEAALKIINEKQEKLFDRNNISEHVTQNITK